MHRKAKLHVVENEFLKSSHAMYTMSSRDVELEFW